MVLITENHELLIKKGDCLLLAVSTEQPIIRLLKVSDISIDGREVRCVPCLGIAHKLNLVTSEIEVFKPKYHLINGILITCYKITEQMYEEFLTVKHF